jgi:predicted  nucleic acid-binding Zn ribbon protein
LRGFASNKIRTNVLGCFTVNKIIIFLHAIRFNPISLFSPKNEYKHGRHNDKIKFTEKWGICRTTKQVPGQNNYQKVLIVLAEMSAELL